MENVERKWNEEYEQILAESHSRGEIPTHAGAEEKRSVPRFHIQTGAIWVQLDIRFEVLEASITGISFKADRTFKHGEILTITLAKAFKIEAEVMDCKMVETDPRMMEISYVTRCRFSDEQSAVCFLVMLKAIDDDEIELSAE